VVDRALAKLTQHRRLLVVGAHPDDEDTSALALVARDQGGEAAYLSLSRGEGGQNLIGPELGVELGVLRSRELLAARRIDGARQFFTRAYDFGYTRSLDETLSKWPREVLLEDAARVVRRFRPQVIVTVFPPDSRAGHGQHEAAGVVAREIFELAGDPDAFPGLASDLSESVAWAPSSLFRATWWDRDETTLSTALGRVDPLTGRSLYQTATASRSMHRSQDMGRVQPLGSESGRYAWVAGPGGPESEHLFAGVDTRLEAIADLLPEGAARDRVVAELTAVRRVAERARGDLAPTRLDRATEDLMEIVSRLREARRAVASVTEDGAPPAGAAAAGELLDEKLEVAKEGLLAAAGVALDAWAEVGTISPGDSFRVDAQVWHGVRSAQAGTAEPAPADPLTVEARGVLVTGAEPWDLQPVVDAEGETIRPPSGPLAPGDLAAWAFYVVTPPHAEPTVPYFLRRPLDGALYDWSEAAPEVRGEPFGPAPVRVRFLLRIGNEDLQVEREVVQRVGDQAVGEVRRPLRVVPRVEVSVQPALSVLTSSEAADPVLHVQLRSWAEYPLAGQVRIEVPAGWRAPEPVRFDIPEAKGEASVDVRVPLPDGLERGHYQLGAVAELGSGIYIRSAYPLVDHPHVRATPVPRPATFEIAAADIRLPELGAIGFVTGASDREPEALAAIGLPVVPLSGDDLAEMSAGALGRFDAVVVGSRAYETDPGLARANGRLLDYARGGGLVLVLYQQYDFVQGEYAPFPLEIARPHDRVTVEEAPATVLVPEHPVFRSPNAIGPEDWEGWVQERGLYFAHTWDDAYTPLLSFPASPGYDPGELRGGLLVAELGEGTWVYTGLAFFRQLPAGVTGAYRLFANLLALAEE
jgi:LmbE family N-acetylglucosaminyl deacetylase